MLFTKAATEAKKYKGYCSKRNLKSRKIQKADSLVSASRNLTNRNLKNRNKDSEAYYTMKLAASYYLLALYDNELSRSKIKLQNLEQSLAQKNDTLDTYKKAIQKIETGIK
jgi:hypothetical protein